MKAMKTILLALIFVLLIPAQIFCAQYRINGVSYNIRGMTKAYAVDREVKVDKTTIFPDEDAFAEYLADYKQRLENTRLFEEVIVEYTTKLFDEAMDLYLADLRVTLDDNFHFLAAPYPRYNSNSGFTLRIRARDSNFLGTMQTMGMNLNLILESDEDDERMKHIVGDQGMTFGFDFDFDYPFQIGFVNAAWTNDYGISYTIGHSSPEWDLATGLDLSFPLGERTSLDFSLTQGFIHEFDYEKYGDDIYFSENARLSLPIVIYRIDNWGDISYSPFVRTTYYWDFDGIDDNNSDLKGPSLSIGQTISTGRVNWVENFRDGLSLSTTQSFTYNIGKKSLVPKFSAEIKAFKAFKWLTFASISSDIYFFVCTTNDTENIGARLRGIRDNQYYTSDYRPDGKDFSGLKALDTSSAIVINIDLPIRIFATNFQKNRLLRTLNFELQISPFLDIAFTDNRATGRTFSIDDGFYAGGLEVIVHLKRWRSIQIRGSLGIDVGRYFLKRWIDTEWRAEVSHYEATFGIGLHY